MPKLMAIRTIWDGKGYRGGLGTVHGKRAAAIRVVKYTVRGL